MRTFLTAMASVFLATTCVAQAGSGRAVTLPLDQMYVGTDYHNGRYTQTRWKPWKGNHPFPTTYPSNYPWTNPVTYNAGPGNTYPAHHDRIAQERHGHRWTGYPPRHLYVVDYNGYAPPYYFLPK